MIGPSFSETFCIKISLNCWIFVVWVEILHRRVVVGWLERLSRVVQSNLIPETMLFGRNKEKTIGPKHSRISRCLMSLNLNLTVKSLWFSSLRSDFDWLRFCIDTHAACPVSLIQSDTKYDNTQYALRVLIRSDRLVVG